MPLAFFYNKIDKLKKIRDMRAEIREQDENAIYLGIFATDEDKLIGFIALHSFNYINKKLKIGYVLNKKYLKRGFMVTMREDYKGYEGYFGFTKETLSYSKLANNLEEYFKEFIDIREKYKGKTF